MSRYRFTNIKTGASSIQDQAGYDAIVAKKWLGKFKVETLDDTPSVPISKRTFLPPEIQQLRATDAVVQKQVEEQTKGATELANQPVPNLSPPIPAGIASAPATSNKTGPRKAKATADN